MNLKLITPRFIFVTSAIVITAVSRLFPHIPNFTPLAAMALFGGVYFSDKRLAVIIPLITLFLSDAALQVITGYGFHNTMVYVYVSFILTSVIGMLVRRNITLFSVAGGAVASSVLFFIITNFGYWASNAFQMGITGLGTSYIMGLPFFAPTLAGDLFFSAVLFGAFYLAQVKFPALVKVK